MNNFETLNSLFNKLEKRFGYQLTERNDKCRYIKFERTVKEGHHILILEDHRWELARDDFDPDTDIGDWLIFSSILTIDEPDWVDETQYPLTYSEYKIIEKIIQKLEKEDEWKIYGGITDDIYKANESSKGLKFTISERTKIHE